MVIIFPHSLFRATGSHSCLKKFRFYKEALEPLEKTKHSDGDGTSGKCGRRGRVKSANKVIGLAVQLCSKGLVAFRLFI